MPVPLIDSYLPCAPKHRMHVVAPATFDRSKVYVQDLKFETVTLLRDHFPAMRQLSTFQMKAIQVFLL